MAQTSSIYNQPLSGNLGNQTYKNYGGKQVVTTRFRTTSAKGAGASRTQRNTRMLMPNLTIIGSQLKDWLPALWENNKFFKRPYTHFISQNMRLNLPVMPKSQIDLQNCVWGPLQVSCGTLQPIRYFKDNSDYQVSDIKLSNIVNFDTFNFGRLSQSIIDGNPSFREGDSIVIVRTPYVAYNSDAPIQGYYCTPMVSAITLDVNSTASIVDSVKGDPISFYFALWDNSFWSLSVTNSGAYSIAFVHVRKVHGKYLASSQLMSADFYAHNRMDNLMSPIYFDYCAASWGYKDKIL